MAVGSPLVVTSGWSKPHSWPWHAHAPLLRIHDGSEKLHYKGRLHYDNEDEGTSQTAQIDWSVGRGGRREVARDERAGRTRVLAMRFLCAIFCIGLQLHE